METIRLCWNFHLAQLGVNFGLRYVFVKLEGTVDCCCGWFKMFIEAMIVGVSKYKCGKMTIIYNPYPK